MMIVDMSWLDSASQLVNSNNSGGDFVNLWHLSLLLLLLLFTT